MKGLARTSLALVFLVLANAGATPPITPARYSGLSISGIGTQNQTTEAGEVALGRALFFDRRLSADGSISCASCHQPEHAYSDGVPVAAGVKSRHGTRNSPSLINVAFNTSLFWDGRRSSLESQALDPILNVAEHGLTSREQLLTIIADDPRYVTAFKEAYSVAGPEIDIDHVASALSSFQRTLIAGDSAFDRYSLSKDEHALSAAAKRGLAVFFGPAGCQECHPAGDSVSLFTDNKYHHSRSAQSRLNSTDLTAATMKVVEARQGDDLSSVLADPQIAAMGRFLVTLNPSDIGKFRTPSLRNVALTAPYMHDGSIATLEEAISAELYRRSDGRGVPITVEERADLKEFLLSLSSSSEALAAISPPFKVGDSTQ